MTAPQQQDKDVTEDRAQDTSLQRRWVGVTAVSLVWLMMASVLLVGMARDSAVKNAPVLRATRQLKKIIKPLIIPPGSGSSGEGREGGGGFCQNPGFQPPQPVEVYDQKDGLTCEKLEWNGKYCVGPKGEEVGDCSYDDKTKSCTSCYVSNFEQKTGSNKCKSLCQWNDGGKRV